MNEARAGLPPTTRVFVPSLFVVPSVHRTGPMTRSINSLWTLVTSSACLTLIVGCSDLTPERAIAPTSAPALDRADGDVDAALQGYLTTLGFTGRIGDQLETRLGR